MVKHVVPFKFFKAWAEHKDCRRLVNQNWLLNVRGTGMVRFQLKLKNLKQVFKNWNHTVFSDVDRQVRLALEEVSRIQLLIDAEGFSDALYAQDFEAQLVLTKALNYQDILWREKARDQNFINGDRNTSYFHRVAKFRAAAKPINLVYNSDTVITAPEDIEVHVLNYFTSIFSIDNDCVQNDMLDCCVPCLVSEEENHRLFRLHLRDEIKDVVFGLNGENAPVRMVLVVTFIIPFGILLKRMSFSRFRNFSSLVLSRLTLTLICLFLFLRSQGRRSWGISVL